MIIGKLKHRHKAWIRVTRIVDQFDNEELVKIRNGNDDWVPFDTPCIECREPDEFMIALAKKYPVYDGKFQCFYRKGQWYQKYESEIVIALPREVIEAFQYYVFMRLSIFVYRVENGIYNTHITWHNGHNIQVSGPTLHFALLAVLEKMDG